MTEVFAIKDTKSGLFYQQKPRTAGWYDSLHGARFYIERGRAERTIKGGDHHVAYPGNRDLLVVPVRLSESSS
jgi:hypothetical protein